MPEIHYTPVEGLNVGFFEEAVHQPLASEKAGRPIYKTIEKVSIIPAGDQRTIYSDIVDDRHRKRWPDLYNRWRAGQDAPGHSGTPIKEWPAVTASQVREMEFFHIHTVEQLAELSDEVISRMGMGYAQLKEKAKATIARASGDASVQAIAAENQRLKDELALQAARQDEQQRQMLERMRDLEQRLSTRAAQTNVLGPEGFGAAREMIDAPVTAADIVAELDAADFSAPEAPRRGRPPKTRD